MILALIGQGDDWQLLAVIEQSKCLSKKEISGLNKIRISRFLGQLHGK